MNQRQEKILRVLIEEYIKNANSVASGFLARKFNDKFSSATIRNELADLEAQDFLAQPHTSAGRIPTIKGYEYYVQNFLQKKTLKIKDQNSIVAALQKATDKRQALKNLAKEIAEISRETVIVAFAKNDVYYTGLSNLFAKPEFQSKDLVLDVSYVIDHLDNAVMKIFDDYKEKKVEINIGDRLNFSKNCSAIIGGYNQEFLIIILGPLRMDYQKNFEIMSFILNIK